MEGLFYYLLKSSFILFLFYGCYQLFLRNETLFRFNRYFLLCGILLSCILPLIVITITIDAPLLKLQNDIGVAYISPKTTTFKELTPYIIFTIFYFTGVLVLFYRVFNQGIHLKKLIKNGQRLNSLTTVHIKTKANIQPFSFFNNMVYNPNNHTAKELEAILAHEEVHASQLHSLDILLTEIFLIFQWFNPITWLYRTAIKQNLEFLADSDNQQIKINKKEYQYVMLLNAVGNHQLSIVNPFFNSLIKKRIVMINQHQSHKSKALKSLIILPLLAFFLVSFNVKEVYTLSITGQSINSSNKIELLIDKDTTDEQLLKIKTDLEKEKFDFSYTTVRNRDGEIKNISLHISGGNKKNGEVSSSFNSASDNDTINPTYILIDTDKNSILIRNAEESNKVIELKKNKSGNNKQVSISTSTSGDYNIKITEEEGNGFMFVTSDNNQEPLFYINGAKSDSDAVNNLNESDIETMNVIKGDSAIKKYGKDAKYGVIEIITKK